MAKREWERSNLIWIQVRHLLKERTSKHHTSFVVRDVRYPVIFIFFLIEIKKWQLLFYSCECLFLGCQRETCQSLDRADQLLKFSLMRWSWETWKIRDCECNVWDDCWAEDLELTHVFLLTTKREAWLICYKSSFFWWFEITKSEKERSACFLFLNILPRFLKRLDGRFTKVTKPSRRYAPVVINKLCSERGQLTGDWDWQGIRISVKNDYFNWDSLEGRNSELYYLFFLSFPLKHNSVQQPQPNLTSTWKCFGHLKSWCLARFQHKKSIVKITWSEKLDPEPTE